MRKALLAVVLVMALAVGAQAASIYLVPSAITVTPSQTFTIDVVVTGVAASPGAESANIEVHFDTSQVDAQGMSEGDFIQQQTGETYMAFGYLIDNTNGVLSYTFTRLGPATSSGSGTVATLTFHCKGVGTSTLDYYAVLSEPSGDDLVAGSGSVDVTQGVIPEPMTLLLVGAAVTALGVVARKRS
jgi:hypothetical protein